LGEPYTDWDTYAGRRKRFLEQCRRIAATRGKAKQYHGSGAVCGSTSAFVYEDDAIKIVTEVNSKAMDIEMLKPHHNPVIMIRKDDSRLRFHGEWTMLEDHVAGLMILDDLANAAT